eukprot:2536129-Amphidinium_carterae.1
MEQRGVRRAPAHQRGAQAQRLEEQGATASSVIAPATRTTTTTSRTRSPRERRATALHPHLDDYPEFYSDGTLGSDASDITGEEESGEEEAREHDEVE